MPEPPDPLTVARAQMAPGERLIWADRPLPRPARRPVIGLVGFGLVFAAVAVFWTAQAWASGLAVAWVGLPLIALGVGFASSAWWRRRRDGVVYAISDRRLLILRGWPQPRVRSFGPDDVQDFELHEQPDGSGDLIFRRETVLFPHPVDEETRRRAMPRIRRTGFFGIPDARRVAAAARKLKETQGVAVTARSRS